MDGDSVAGTQQPAGGERNTLDVAAAPYARWLTPRRVILFVIVWLGAFSAGSVVISNPFASETTAAAAPDYWHVMYLHGLLIGMVGLIALAALEAFESCCSVHVRFGIVAGVVGATVLTAMGGIWNTRVPGAEAAMWTQITGFFFLDEILILLMIGFWQGWRARLPSSRSLPYVVGWMASASMFIAALMGHLGGWILEFGDHPWFLGNWASAVGEKLSDLSTNLIGSHSHEMAVASMALVLTAGLHRFGYLDATGLSRGVSRAGMLMAGAGIIAMTGVYVAMAVTSWVVPTYFQSAHGANGVAGDDLLTGILVMGGGLLALWPVVSRLAARARSWAGSALPVAAAWAWTGILVGVVIGGFSIELNETFFGAGGKAPGAANDAIFTWIHQDIGLFLFPALFAILVLSGRLVTRRYKGLIGWSALAGVTLLLLGGGVWVFVSPVVHGAGYVLSTAGLVFLVGSIAVTFVSGLLGDGKLRLAVPSRLHSYLPR